MGSGWQVWQLLTEPGANLLVILAECVRRQLVTRRRQRERDRVANHWHGLFSNTHLDDGIESDFARERDPPFDTVDRAAGDACRAQPLEPFASCSCAQPFHQQRAQGFTVASAILRLGKSGRSEE